MAHTATNLIRTLLVDLIRNDPTIRAVIEKTVAEELERTRHGWREGAPPDSPIPA
jgi:hypothetical protein